MSEPKKFAMPINEQYQAAVKTLLGDTEEFDKNLNGLYLLIEMTGPMEFNAKMVAEEHLLNEEGAIQEDILLLEF